MESTQMSIYRWSKQNDICTYNGIVLSLKKEWNSDVIWMNLEDFMLSGRNPSEKDNIVWFDLCDVRSAVKLIETESRMVIIRG